MSVPSTTAPCRVESLEARRLFAAAALPRPDHVVIVVEENHSYSEIIGSPSAPYINGLAAGGASFTNSHGVTHPSQPNYLALFSGSTQGIKDDSAPHTFKAANLGSELIAARRTFAGYSEDLPAVGSTVSVSKSYWRKHNPWVNFTNVPAADNLPMTRFPTDYTKLPTVSFVVPNQDNDMHDGSVKTADAWLKSHLDGYATWAKKHNCLLIVTWDEDDTSSNNQIPTIFYGASVKAGKYKESITHYNVLRTVEDFYALPRAGASATAAPVSDVWTSPAAKASSASPAPFPSLSATKGTAPLSLKKRIDDVLHDG